MKAADNRLILFGAGGHAKSVIGVIDVAKAWRVVGLVEDGEDRVGQRVLGYEILGGADALARARADGVVRFFVAVGDNVARGAIARRMVAAGFSPVSIIHPSAFLMKNAAIGEGVFLHFGSVTGPDSTVGSHTIVGAHAAVGHDSTVGDCVHLAAGARMGGHTKIGAYSLLGMGAVVLPGVTIGRNVSVGANAVVHRDLPDRCVAVGNPARVVRRNEGPDVG